MKLMQWNNITAPEVTVAQGVKTVLNISEALQHELVLLQSQCVGIDNGPTREILDNACKLMSSLNLWTDSLRKNVDKLPKALEG